MDITLGTSGIMPINKHDSAGYDLSSPITLNLAPKETIFLDLGIAIHIANKSLVGLIYPRSSLGLKGLRLLNTVAVIDSDYIGNIKLALINDSNIPLEIQAKDRIAQIVFTQIQHTTFTVVDSHKATVRGIGGFGSTGEKS